MNIAGLCNPISSLSSVLYKNIVFYNAGLQSLRLLAVSSGIQWHHYLNELCKAPDCGMTEKYYVDTSIWRDYYEDRSDGIGTR
jgi:hypothetical protein